LGIDRLGVPNPKGDSAMIEYGMSQDLGEYIARSIWIPYERDTDNCLGVFKNGRPLGGVVFTEYNYANIVVHWGSVESTGHWLTQKVLWFIADYCFNQLNVQRITAYEHSSDAHLVALVEKLGFKLEATQYGYYPDGDRLCYVMRRDMCPWLKYGDRYGRKA
jgi:RimJ/RimL family protein N-acetyltransferase